MSHVSVGGWQEGALAEQPFSAPGVWGHGTRLSSPPEKLLLTAQLWWAVIQMLLWLKSI